MREEIYSDPLKTLTDVINWKSDNQIINSFSYMYNNLDVRGSETITNGNPITTFQNEQIGYDYNNVNQLLSSTNPNRTFTYDDDGNMTQGYTPEVHFPRFNGHTERLGKILTLGGVKCKKEVDGGSMTSSLRKKQYDL